MLKTFNEAQEDALDLIHRYVAWKRNDVEQILNSKDRPSRLQVEIITGQAERFAVQARALISKGGVRPDEIDDLTAIAEELEAAANEGHSECSPDTIWSSLDEKDKRRITQSIPFSKEKADRLRARMRGDLRAKDKNPK